jgi:hypothetical protein
MNVIIEPKTVSLGKIQSLLKATLPPEIELNLSQQTNKRGVDPTILVASIGGAGTLLGALITGLFQILKEARTSKLVIVGASGRKVEIPANASNEELARAIEAARVLDAERISLLP